jgi:hypothetical protein
MGVTRRLSTGQVFLTNQVVTLMGLDPSETLLPTPTVGMMMGGSLTRSGARNGEMLLPGVAKDLIGRSMSPRSGVGKADSGGQLRGQLNLQDALEPSS